MKRLLAFLLLVPVSVLTAQQPGIDQSSDLLILPAGDKFLRWHGHEDRTYFIQVSDSNNTLAKWFWAPVIESGNDEEISHEVDGTASKGFYRLLHTTLPQPPGVTLEDWDADDDRLNNWEEITSHGSHPLKSDTDDDGLPDDWEIAHGLNVLDDGTDDPDRGPDAPFPSQSGGSQGASAFAAPQSPLTNVQAFLAGIRAVTGATIVDKDGDLILDAEDADPLSRAVNWRKSPKPVYAAIPVSGWSSAAHSFPVRLNNRNSVLTGRAVYQNGQWISINGYFSAAGQGPALSYKFLIDGRLHPCHLGQCVVNSISDQGDVMGTGKILIDSVTVTDPVTGQVTTHTAGYSPDFAMIWRNPQALPEIFGVAPGATLQGARHAQAGILHRDGTVLIWNKRPEDIFVNNDATLQRWPNSANGGGIQTSPVFSSPTYSYPAVDGTFAFNSYLATGQIAATLSWIWPASSGPQSLYSVTHSAPGAPSLNFQSLPTTIGTAPSGEACINLAGQVLVGRSGRYYQVPALQGATKISPHGAALLSGTSGNPTIWYGGSTYSLSSCVSNPQALGTTLTVTDINEDGSILAIVNVGTGSQRLVTLHPVEIIDKDGIQLEELKIGKMYPDVLSGNGLGSGPVNVNLDKDEDRFFVRMKGTDSLGSIKMKFETVDNPDANYNDNPTEYALESEDGDVTTKSMILVSDDIDDNHLASTAGDLDNSPDDRTHVIQLGGNFKISAIKIGAGDWVPVDIKIPVKKKKTAKIQFVNCTYGVLNIDPCWDLGSIEWVQRKMRERYAQVGLDFDFPPVVAGPWVSAGGSMDDDEIFSLPSGTGKIVFPPESKNLVDQGPPNDFNNTLMIYLVNGLDSFRGVASPPKYVNVADARFQNKVFLARYDFKDFTASHEALHVLADAAHDVAPYLDFDTEYSSIHTVWAVPPPSQAERRNNGSIGSTKRISHAQEVKIQSSPLSK